MRYHVEFVDLVLDYLAAVEGLTDEDRAAIVEGVSEELARDAEHFLALYPLAQEALCFRYDYAQATPTGVHTFDFVVSAHHLEMGVVTVVYVEHSVRPLP
ncbi:MAG: hypothetical protein U0736_10485 [Gemmataceae bacterium]